MVVFRVFAQRLKKKIKNKKHFRIGGFLEIDIIIGIIILVNSVWELEGEILCVLLTLKLLLTEK